MFQSISNHLLVGEIFMTKKNIESRIQNSEWVYLSENGTVGTQLLISD